MGKNRRVVVTGMGAITSYWQQRRGILEWYQRGQDRIRSYHLF